MSPFIVELFKSDDNSSPTAYPRAEVNVPQGYKIIGGGAKVHWTHPGNHLVESYPENFNKWVASARESQHPAPSTIVAWAIALHDPNDEWEVQIFKDTSRVEAHPKIRAAIENGYILTGGGAKTHPAVGAISGNFLTASFPSDNFSWEARSKDHNESSPAAITAYAIGIRPRNKETLIISDIVSLSSSIEAHPSCTVAVREEYTLTGGGAFNWKEGGSGNLLTASYPMHSNTWAVAGKDHFVPSPSSITAYAIGVKVLKY